MRNSLIVRDPFGEFDRLVSRAFGPSALEAPVVDRRVGFAPAAEAFRDGEDAVVRLELPGVEVGKDVTVEVVDGRLVISGERRDERAEDGEGRRIREFRYGSFTRSFRLGPQITAEQVSASYDAGVLTVRVRDAYAKSAGQRIEIQTTPVAAVEAPQPAEVVEGGQAEQA